MVIKIISGGQTGADQGGLEAAKMLGMSTGGTAPAHYTTEIGFQPSLANDYNLIESSSSLYSVRTKQNIINSDGTVVFGKTRSLGTALTLRLCGRYQKPTLINPDKSSFASWVSQHNIRILNVSGNRESVNPGIQEKVRNFLLEALADREG